jgi:hypothetical protein
MGGDLAAAGGDAPTLLVRAIRDPDGANLDRVQVIKGWRDARGELHERIYDVACSDGRHIVGRRCDGTVGNTVNLESGSYRNDTGAPYLAVFWEDPDFDAGQRAFYYVRVLEIPTPSWLAYDKAFYGESIELPDDAVLVQQERAYTSPIWYTP